MADKLSTIHLPSLLSFSGNRKTVIEITKSRDEGHLPGMLPRRKMSLRKAKM